MLSLWNRFGFVVIPNFTRNCPRSKERRAYTHPVLPLQVFFNKYTKLIRTRFISRTISKCITFINLYMAYLGKSMGEMATRKTHVALSPIRFAAALSGRSPDTRRKAVGFAALTHGTCQAPLHCAGDCANKVRVIRRVRCTRTYATKKSRSEERLLKHDTELS